MGDLCSHLQPGACCDQETGLQYSKEEDAARPESLEVSSSFPALSPDLAGRESHLPAPDALTFEVRTQTFLTLHISYRTVTLSTPARMLWDEHAAEVHFFLPPGALPDQTFPAVSGPPSTRA